MIEEVEKELKKGKDIEKILEKFDWKIFEDIVSKIFERNGYKVKKNLRIGKKEFDVVAENPFYIFLIDCKFWSKHRYKKSQLKNYAKRLEEKSKILAQNLKGKKMVKLIVTLHQEDLIIEENTFFVPVFKLNNFLNEIYKYV